MNAACEFDHLVIGAHTLAQGAAFVSELLDVELQTGGQHAAMGTHNMVLKLGARAYLEVIAIDPAAETPARPRWFGLDDEGVRRRIRAQPRLLAWAARTLDIAAAASNCPIALGAVQAMTRGRYQWRITIPGDGALVNDGLLPALIQWEGDIHPAANLRDRSCELITLEGSHPTPGTINAALIALGVKDTLSVTPATAPRLAARIRGPHGVYEIAS
jgi:hypothetical protein